MVTGGHSFVARIVKIALTESSSGSYHQSGGSWKMQRQGSPYGLVTLRAPHSAGLPPGETDAVGRGQLGAGEG